MKDEIREKQTDEDLDINYLDELATAYQEIGEHDLKMAEDLAGVSYEVDTIIKE